MPDFSSFHVLVLLAALRWLAAVLTVACMAGMRFLGSDLSSVQHRAFHLYER